MNHHSFLNKDHFVLLYNSAQLLICIVLISKPHKVQSVYVLTKLYASPAFRAFNICANADWMQEHFIWTADWISSCLYSISFFLRTNFCLNTLQSIWNTSSSHLSKFEKAEWWTYQSQKLLWWSLTRTVLAFLMSLMLIGMRGRSSQGAVGQDLCCICLKPTCVCWF